VAVNDSAVVVPSASCAVTVMVDVSPCFACVVSMMSTPLGLVADNVVEVIVSGFFGCEASPLDVLSMTGTWVIWASVLTPVSIWPKTV
jgi:hypothetical protein